MKKLPTLFRREFQDHHIIRIMPELSRPELSWVLAGEGVATEKIDGAVALVMALDRAMKNQSSGDSVYDDRGLLLL